MSTIIISLVGIPLVGGILVLMVPKENEKFSKLCGLVVSLIVIVLSFSFLIFFDASTAKFQFFTEMPWIGSSSFFSFGVDGISLFFVLLTTFLIPLCLLASWEMPMVKSNLGYKEYFAAFLFLEAFILIVFCTLDLLMFYTFFEAVLIPIFLIVGVWGSRERRVRASYILFLYTLFGSLFILLGLLVIYFEAGTFDYVVLSEKVFFSYNKQLILWLAFFISFAVKIPIVPVHIWLPEAHVEAPTAGSVILAGILLKLGSYGLLRYSLVLFPAASLYFRPFVFVLAIVGIIYTSLTALRQSDIKRVIAYASVAHINTTLLGIFSFNLVGFEGGLFQMMSHGLVSGALFLCVGVLYDRHHSRIIQYYSGIAVTIPFYVLFFLFFTIANIALPGTASFVGEFLIFAGAFDISKVGVFFGATGMFLGGGYSLWLFNRVAYGNFKIQYLQKTSFDIVRREYYTFVPLTFLVLYFGIFPGVFFEVVHISSINLLERVILNL